jgi:hypothetical protein
MRDRVLSFVIRERTMYLTFFDSPPFCLQALYYEFVNREVSGLIRRNVGGDARRRISSMSKEQKTINSPIESMPRHSTKIKS